MNAIRREPAATAGAAAALVSAALAILVVRGDVMREEADAWYAFALALLPLLNALQAWFTRSRVMPVETLREAGLDPKQVKRDAADTTIAPFRADGAR